MPYKYHKPEILKKFRLFDVDCSTSEHEVVFTDITLHLDVERNFTVFCACIDLFGWPEKIEVTFSNMGDITETEKDWVENIRKQQSGRQHIQIHGPVQDYLFLPFKYNESQFINAELRSVVKPEELHSQREWVLTKTSGLEWNGKDFNPQFLDDFKDCRGKLHIKNANYDFLIHQVGTYLAFSFMTADAPLDLFNNFIRIIEAYGQIGASFKHESNNWFILDGLPPDGIIAIFRCLAGTILSWNSNYDPGIPGIIVAEKSPSLANLSYLKTHLHKYMQLAEDQNYYLKVELESDQSGPSPYKYVVLDEEENISEIRLTLTRAKVDEIGFWNIAFEHNWKIYLPYGQYDEIFEKFNAHLHYVSR